MKDICSRYCTNCSDHYPKGIKHDYINAYDIKWIYQYLNCACPKCHSPFPFCCTTIGICAQTY